MERLDTEEHKRDERRRKTHTEIGPMWPQAGGDCALPTAPEVRGTHAPSGRQEGAELVLTWLPHFWSPQP